MGIEPGYIRIHIICRGLIKSTTRVSVTKNEVHHISPVDLRVSCKFLSFSRFHPDRLAEPNASTPTTRNLRVLSPRPKLMRGLSRALRLRLTVSHGSGGRSDCELARSTQSDECRPIVRVLCLLSAPSTVPLPIRVATTVLLIERPPLDVAYGGTAYIVPHLNSESERAFYLPAS
jgi:hypothetical protein